MAVRNTALLPQILVHGTRSFHSEGPGKGSEDVTQRPDGIAGYKFSALVTSSSPMPSNTKIILFTIIISGLPIYMYLKGRKDGAQDLTAQLPDCKFFTEREALRKEHEKLKLMYEDMPIGLDNGLQEQRIKLAQKVETLDREELEHLRQRAMVLERRLKPQRPSADIDAAKDHISRIRRIQEDVKSRVKELEHLRQRAMVLERRLKPQGQSADNDAAKDDASRIRGIKEAPKSREKELEAQTKAKDQKKRIQELNEPKSERVSSVASSMLFGSALAFGVTMIMSVVENSI